MVFSVAGRTVEDRRRQLKTDNVDGQLFLRGLIKYRYCLLTKKLDIEHVYYFHTTFLLA